MRREWLTGIIKDVHVASRGTYGYRRVHAELTQAHGVFVSANLVNLLMHNAAIAGLPGPGRASRNSGVPTGDDLVNRRFNRDGLNELWVSDITEHKTPWIPAIVATVGTTWRPVKQIGVRLVYPSRELSLVGH
jgi:putative transposase